MKQKKTNATLERMRREKGLDKGKDEEVRPTHFDLAPFFTAIKRFLACNGEQRSKLRMELR